MNFATSVRCDDVAAGCLAGGLQLSLAFNTPNSIHCSPPSGVISTFFRSLQGTKPSQQQIKAITKQVLLSPADVEMWIEHISTVQLDRKRGAARAAAT